MAEGDSSSIEVLSKVNNDINSSSINMERNPPRESTLTRRRSLQSEESDSSDDENRNERYELSIEELLGKSNTTSSRGENNQDNPNNISFASETVSESPMLNTEPTPSAPKIEEIGGNEYFMEDGWDKNTSSEPNCYPTYDSHNQEDDNPNIPKEDSFQTHSVQNSSHFSPGESDSLSSPENNLNSEKGQNRKILAVKSFQDPQSEHMTDLEKAISSVVSIPTSSEGYSNPTPPTNSTGSNQYVWNQSWERLLDPNQGPSSQIQPNHPQSHPPPPKTFNTEFPQTGSKITPQLSSKLSQSSHNLIHLFFSDPDHPSTKLSQNNQDNWNWDDASFVQVPLSPRFCDWETLSIKLVTLRSQCETSELQKDPTQIKIIFEQMVSSYQRKAPLLSNFKLLSRREISSHIVATLPLIIHHALQLPLLLSKPIPILAKGHPRTIFLTKKLCLSFLANGFLCTWPKPRDSLGDLNFFRLFHSGVDEEKNQVKTEKIMCILNYFHQMNVIMNTQSGSENISDKIEDSILSFERRCGREKVDWSSSTKSLSEVQVDPQGKIEEKFGMLQVDFANKNVGGGVLNEGSVMEEIRFSICPELLAARLFTQELEDDEVLVIMGAQQFSKYEGYARSFKYRGPENQNNFPKDEFGRMMTEIVAMDATPWRGGDTSLKQFKKECLDRELHKAFVGFKVMENTSPVPVATGNWGCGAFNGDPELKFLIQWLAASECRRRLCYHTMGNLQQADKTRDLETSIRGSRGINVGILYKIVVQFYGENSRRGSLFDFVMHRVNTRGNGRGIQMNPFRKFGTLNFKL